MVLLYLQCSELYNKWYRIHHSFTAEYANNETTETAKVTCYETGKIENGNLTRFSLTEMS